ncbi:MAG: VanZ family protein [Clostridia bacterium]|nr:VanZ family protein [Clostridia bacterium]
MSVLLIAQILIITMFSSQTAEKSSEISKSIMDKMEWVPESIPRETPDRAGTISLHQIIRKLAHFYNFFIVGVLLGAIYISLKENGRQALLWASFGLLVAIADELHQHFVPGRSAEVYDVLVDFSGVLFGMSFIKVFLGIIFAKRCRK